MKMLNAAPMGLNRRVSSDSAWPLRGADGLTYAERKARQESDMKGEKGNDEGDSPRQ